MVDRLPPPQGRLEVEEAQAEIAGEGDVLGLADVEPLAVGVAGHPARGGDRGQAHRLPLGVDDPPLDVVEGHRTQVWLATAPEEEIEPRTGGYWHHRAPREPHRATRDAAFQASVLAHLEGVTGIRVGGLE